MLRLRRTDGLLIFMLGCLYLLSCFLMSYVERQQQYRFLTNEMYTNHYAAFANPAPNDDLVRLSESGYRLFLRSDRIHKFLLANPEGWLPPMRSGKFIDEEAPVPQAVVGRSMLDSTYLKEGIRYLDYTGTSYEVIGVMGASFVTPVDQSVILHHPRISTVTRPGQKIILDSREKKNMDRLTSAFVAANPAVKRIPALEQGLSRTNRTSGFFSILIAGFVGLIVISHVSFQRYWYERHRPVLSVLRILGVKDRQLFGQLLVKNSLCSIIAAASIGLVVRHVHVEIAAGAFIAVAIASTVLNGLLQMIFGYLDRLHANRREG